MGWSNWTYWEGGGEYLFKNYDGRGNTSLFMLENENSLPNISTALNCPKQIQNEHKVEDVEVTSGGQIEKPSFSSLTAVGYFHSG